jgi:DNA-binding transcriptional regulator LsrR (DeoR family)
MSRDQLDQRALQADSLRKQGMTKAEIASHLAINEQQVGRLIARAGRY